MCGSGWVPVDMLATLDIDSVTTSKRSLAIGFTVPVGGSSPMSRRLAAV